MSDSGNTAPNDGAASSLLSLSIAAANADPIPIAQLSDPSVNIGGVINGNGHPAATGSSVSTSVGGGAKHHRRLASTGKARRRLSDARDAATRPSPASLQTTAAALSLASLSLSSSPPPGAHQQTSTSFAAATNAIPIPAPASRTPTSAIPISRSAPLEESTFPSPPTGAPHIGLNGFNGVQVAPISNNGSGAKNGKKRGTTFTCESCSKVYRHPSCLIKHRWEHSPHWREASKYVLSKHQQVQLLEAAAILSHLSPSSATGTSLPDDRSLWPSFLSGGTLPPPSATDEDQDIPPASPMSPTFAGHPTSSSVPATSVLSNRSASIGAGPRLHDYSVPTGTTTNGGLTQLRPGLLGVPTGSVAIQPSHSDTGSLSPSAAVPVPLPNGNGNYYRGEYGSISGRSEPWGSPAASLHYTHSSYQSAGVPTSEGTGGWSLPRSSVRSVSVSSRSRSKSLSEEEDEYVDVGIDVGMNGTSYIARGRVGWKREAEDGKGAIGYSVREEDEEAEDGIERGQSKEDEWDGMDMDMEME